MTSYVNAAFCDGHRPRRYFEAAIHSRPELLSRLMRERQVARFLVAPSGYGKSYLALEYAQVMFQFKGTAWIMAQSPCFLRDLDSGSLMSDLLAREDDLKLVVFDDVPRLGNVRAGMFSGVIDALLERSVEVIVTCHPPCDAYSGRQIDRICLKASDLLLSDAEVASIQLGGEEVAFEPQNAVSGLFSADATYLAEEALGKGGRGPRVAWRKRIPQLVWGGTNALTDFTMGARREELPEALISAVFLILALREAELSWACEQYGLPADNVMELASDYPHLGIRRETDSFCAIEVPHSILVKVFGSGIFEIMGVFGLTEVDDLAWKVAGTLLELGQPGRACEHMVEFCRKDARAEWAKAYAARLFALRCTLPAYYVSRSVIAASVSGAVGVLLESQNAWRLALLGDTRAAVECAMHALSHAGATADVRAWCLLLLASSALKEKVLEGVHARLALLIEAVESAGEASSRDWYVLAACCQEARWAGRGEGNEAFANDVWPGLAQETAHADIALWGASLLVPFHPELAHDRFVQDFARRAEESFTSAHVMAFRKLNDFVKTAKTGEDGAESRPSRLSDEALAQALSDIEGMKTERITRNIAEAEDRLMGEIQAYRANNERRKRQAKRQSSGANYAQAGGAQEKEDDTPVLTVNVLGGFELARDGKPLMDKAFGQMKVRALLTLLVLADGREKSKTNIVDSLWPKLALRSGLKNLYTTWSTLVRALSLPDGTNPYIVRSQGSYRIVKQFVQTDISRVNQICKEVTMGQVSQQHLCDLLDELNRVYKGDLLPSEVKNEWILEERRRYRHQVTNLFSNASLQLVDLSQPQTALWFSQIAMRHETRREDMYYALMTSQLACGQRESALETYHSCTKMLAQNFGIDPSIRMVTLYRSIVEHERAF